MEDKYSEEFLELKEGIHNSSYIKEQLEIEMDNIYGVFHNFKIEEDLVELLNNTSFKNNLIHLPFTKVKINEFIEIGDGKVIHNIFLIETNIGIQVNFIHTNFKLRSSAIANLHVTKELKFQGERSIQTSKWTTEERNNMIEEDAMASENKIINFVGNFLNYISSRDVEISFIDRTKFNPRYIEKKIKKGKIPNPYIHNVILIGKTKKIYEKLKKERGNQKFSNSFWVRGHWRHLDSIIYKNKRYKNVWILPYIKGVGKLIKKDYEVKK